jgi:hypothetical protein
MRPSLEDSSNGWSTLFTRELFSSATVLGSFGAFPKIGFSCNSKSPLTISDTTISYYMMKNCFTIWMWGLALSQLALADDGRMPAVEQRTQSFTIELNGSVAEVTPLFGPVREAEWAPDWSPRFIYPPQGSQREGAVFSTTSGHGKDRVWLLTTYDVSGGRVEYVVMTPASTANEIKIRVTPDGDRRCKATVMYRRSALTPEANDDVAKLDANWAEEQRSHWQTAINEALAKGRIHD